MADDIFDSKLFRITGIGKSVRVYIPATIVYRGTSFIRGIILAWLLARQTGQYSLLTIALQVINILAPLVSLGLNEAITRYVSAYHQRNKLKQFLLKSSLLVSGITFSFCLILFAFSEYLGKFIFANNYIAIQESVRLAHASLITIFAITLYFLIASVLKGLRMFLALSILELVHGILFLIMSIVGVLYISRHAEIVIWSYIASLLIPTILLGAMFINNIGKIETSNRTLPIKSLSFRLIRYGFWAAISGIIWQSWQMFSLWYLTKFNDASLGDTFAAARLIAQLIVIVGIALSIIVMTSVFVKWEQGKREQANMLLDFYTKIVFLAMLGCSLLLVGFRHYLAFVFPEKFSGAAIILPQMILFFYLATVLTFLAIHFVLLEKTILMLWPWTAGLISNIAFAILWIKGPNAITGAVSSAYISAVPAIIVAFAIILSKKQIISLGTVLLIVASVILILPNSFSWLIYIGLLIWTLTGTYILSQEQKHILKQKISSFSS